MNLGDADRVARVLAGATLAWIAFAHVPYGTTRVVMALTAAWLLATCVSGWDPFYAIFRFSTVDRSPSGGPTRIK